MKTDMNHVAYVHLVTHTQVVTPVFFDKNDAVKFWTQINKDKEPRIEVFDLSALIKKVPHPIQ